VRLVIVSPRERRNRPGRSRDAGADDRVNLTQLRALLGSDNKG